MADLRSRIEKVRDILAEELAGISETSYPTDGTTTSSYPYRTTVRRVYRHSCDTSTIANWPVICIVPTEDELLPQTQNWQVFDEIVQFHVYGFYSTDKLTHTGHDVSAAEAYGSMLLHDIKRCLMWTAVRYVTSSTTGDRFEIDLNTYTAKAELYDYDKNRGEVYVTFKARLWKTDRDFM